MASQPPRPPIICYDLHTNTNARRSAPPLTLLQPTAATTNFYCTPSDAETIQTATCGCHCDRNQNVCCNTNTLRYQQPVAASNVDRRPKVTIVHRDQNELNKTEAGAWWNQCQSHRQQHHVNHQPQRVYRTQHIYPTNDTSGLARARPMSHHEARFAYDQATRQQVDDRARARERETHRNKLIAEIDRIKNDLSVVKQGVDEAPEMIGMSHKTAEYVESMLQEIVALRRQFNLYTETRSKEVERKTLMERQRERELQAEARRLRDLSNFTQAKQAANTTNPFSKARYNDSTSSGSQSSMGSSSSSSGLASSLSPPTVTRKTSTVQNARGNRIRTTLNDTPRSSATKSIRFDENVTINLETDSSTSSLSPSSCETSTPTPISATTRGGHKIITSSPAMNHRGSSLHNISRPLNSTLEKFSFYKGNPYEENMTLEVTDLDFFDKVEDKTMMEVNGLVNRMQSVLQEVEREKALC